LPRTADLSVVAPSMSGTPPWAGGFEFAPDAVRAVGLDQAVRAGLADSLTTVFDNLDFVPDGDRVTALLNRVMAGPVPPALFGCYFELVLALFDQRDDAAAALVDELLLFPTPEFERLRIVTLDDRDLGLGQSGRYRRLLRADIGGEIQPLSESQCAESAVRLSEALDLLRLAVPALAAELAGLVREILLASPERGQRGFEFGGASTFSLWGALVLNAEGFGGRLDIAVSLAHEAAHTLLFGLALGVALTENDPAERYRSPLRQAPRPMEGVAHATFVTGRMIYALEALIGSGLLGDNELAWAREQLMVNEQACDGGLEIVFAEARFTPAGTSAFAGLRHYMDGQRARRVP
jgi:HEXXH motif-containing protein